MRSTPSPTVAVGEPTLWWCERDRLGDRARVSAQSPELLDREACERAGLAIVRRRSGGGAVLVAVGRDGVDRRRPPTRQCAPDDVRGSMVVGGRVLGSRALDMSRVTPPCTSGAHAVCTAWSGSRVLRRRSGRARCSVGDRKLVGLSQRRTRHGTPDPGHGAPGRPRDRGVAVRRSGTPAEPLPMPARSIERPTANRSIASRGVGTWRSTPPDRLNRTRRRREPHPRATTHCPRAHRGRAWRPITFGGVLG